VSVAPGTRLGQYEVQDFIGQGAMGLVYRAYHTQLERIGAVKVMQAITPDADTVARFRHEAQAIAKMRHPNIVDVYDFGEFEGTPYMIVEYVPGGSLAGRMNRAKLDQATALKYLRGIAAGLDYAHDHGVVHRDVKPANVLLTADDQPVLADFGLAKLLQGSSLKSMTGVTTGTPAYMAPEQVTGSRVGPAADRYSLATIAYEMLTGVIPFDGEALLELLYAQVHREPPAPSSREPSLGPQVDAVVARGLAKDPAARWESSTAFVDALAAALSRAPAVGVAKTMVMAPQVASTVPLAAAGVAERVAAKPQPATVAMAYPIPGGAPVAAPVTKRKSRRRLIALIAAAAIVVLLIGTIALLALGTPTLTLSSSTVAPGEDVVVSATRVPANQAGEIQLHSVIHTFPFKASASGNVAIDITVPRDIGFGDHLVALCYNAGCHAQKTLHVVSRVAFASPTTIGNVTPGTTPTVNASPTAGSTPRPTSTPGSTPTPTATSAPPPAPYITNASISKLNGFYVAFHYFGGGTWNVSVVQLGRPYGAGGVTIPTGSTYFTQKFNTPAAVLSLQQAYIVACNSSAKCYPSSPVTVGP
jgi:protein kinase-like protein